MSKVFQNTRFLCTSTQRKNVYESFFSQFGISHNEEIEVQPLNPSEAVLLAESSGIEFTDPQSLILETEGVPLKILKFVNKSITVTNNSVKDMNENDQNEPSKFDDFSEKELGFLLHASYPTRINRYNLEFFCSPRDAAFCFNWLKRRKYLVQSTADGDLLLNSDLRQKMRDFHAQEAPQEAEKMSILASVLDAFIDRFPNPNLHWIPINLQVFNACTIDLCKKVFNEVEVEEITEFIDTHQEQFQINQNFFSLDEEAKLVTRRFMEVSDSECMEGLTEKVIKQWENDQNRAEKKKAKMLTEQENFKSEITEIDEQIQAFAQLKENILDNFKRPPSTKPKKVYSFGNSLILIVLGLGTVGASLFSENLGSYHAACGLALTLFGFFWPSVDVRKPKIQGVGAGPKLAIETQHRSLDHRINGLSTRANSIKNSLNQIENDLERISLEGSEPYIIQA